MEKKPGIPLSSLLDDPGFMTPADGESPFSETLFDQLRGEAEHERLLVAVQAELKSRIARGRKFDQHNAGHHNIGPRNSRYAVEYDDWLKALADERIEHPEKAVFKCAPAIKRRTGTKAGIDAIHTFLRKLDAEN